MVEHLLGRMPEVFDPWLTARNANKWLKSKKLGQLHVEKATLDRADFIPYLVEGANSVYGVLIALDVSLVSTMFKEVAKDHWFHSMAFN